MADERFMLLNLRDNKSKKLAQVIGNETARQIVDFLASKDFATESHISQHLDIPLSTVHYNMKALKESGLVVSEEFHYSGKGKEVPHYKLAKKFIIIAPRGDESALDTIKKFLPFTALSVVASALVYTLHRWFNPSRLAGADDKAALLLSEQAPEIAARSLPLLAQDSEVMVASSQEVLNESVNLTAQAPIILADAASLPATYCSTLHPAAWFLAGSLFIVLVIIIWELLKRKKAS